MVNLNVNVGGLKGVWGPGSLPHKDNPNSTGAAKANSEKLDFANTVNALEKYICKVDALQQSSDMSIKDLLAGKNEDITSVVSMVTKADMSFKLLVGIRNKLIEAYKQTMNMPL